MEFDHSETVLFEGACGRVASVHAGRMIDAPSQMDVRGPVESAQRQCPELYLTFLPGRFLQLIPGIKRIILGSALFRTPAIVLDLVLNSQSKAARSAPI
jgi:hypothetical protein